MTKKYYHLICDEGEAWVDYFGSYDKQEIEDEWDCYQGYYHPHYSRNWMNKDKVIIVTDGSHTQMVAALDKLNESKEVAS